MTSTKDPGRAPGFQFSGTRLLKAQYQLFQESPAPSEGELTFLYDDEIEVQGLSIVVRQTVHARIVDSKNRAKTYVDARVELEGRFEGTSGANFSTEDFANDHAPAILFPFVREWLQRLTSDASPWPAIVLPPMNVMQLRKQKASQAK